MASHEFAIYSLKCVRGSMVVVFAPPAWNDWPPNEVHDKSIKQQLVGVDYIWWNDVMAAILKMWRHIENTTQAIDAYLHQEQSCMPNFIQIRFETTEPKCPSLLWRDRHKKKKKNNNNNNNNNKMSSDVKSVPDLRTKLITSALLKSLIRHVV